MLDLPSVGDSRLVLSLDLFINMCSSYCRREQRHANYEREEYCVCEDYQREKGIGCLKFVREKTGILVKTILKGI